MDFSRNESNNIAFDVIRLQLDNRVAVVETESAQISSQLLAIILRKERERKKQQKHAARVQNVKS